MLVSHPMLLVRAHQERQKVLIQAAKASSVSMDRWVLLATSVELFATLTKCTL